MTYMFGKKSCLEVLEARIAPATIAAAGHVGDDIVSAVVNSATYLKAGETLGTQNSGGSYLMYVESGTALVFSTDLNKNGAVDSNEITGIAAGNNLSLISFVDIHGDIVTDLKSNGTLSDSDNDASNNNPLFAGDGRSLLNSSIAKIELRSLTTSDLAGDSPATDNDVLARLSLSSYSIYGNIFAGAGFGTVDGEGGLIIDTTGTTYQATKFIASDSNSVYVAATPSIGSIFVGTAASGHRFSFGASDLVAGSVGSPAALNVGGKITTFTPAAGVAGGSIIGISAVGDVSFNLDGLQAGSGGIGGAGQVGGAGGSIIGVTLGGDEAGGYIIKAGNGASGSNGGKGGLVTNFSDLGTSTGKVLIQTGSGGEGTGHNALVGIGGNGGKATFGTMNIFGNLTVKMGDGGDGYNHGGNGRGLPLLNLTTGVAGSDGVSGLDVVATWRNPSSASGNLGRVLPIDFNGDGIGDVAFTTTSPNQLTVAISDGASFLRYDLAVSGKPNSLTVGDFDGNGTPDIAVAYIDAGGTAGVSIYTGSMQGGAFVFDDAQSSALPQLLTYSNSDVGGYLYLISAQPVTALVSGDFNHDGKADLALSAILTAPKGSGATEQRDVIFYLEGDGTGKVFANFSNGAVPFIDVQKHSNSNYVQLQAAGLGGADSDVLFYGAAGDKFITEVDFSQGDPMLGTSYTKTIISLEKVDTNRKVVDQGKAQIASQDATLLNFTVGDLDADGDLDIAVLTRQPTEFLVTFEGDGAGAFDVASGSGNQAGIVLVSGTADDAPAILNDKFEATGLRITTGPGSTSQIAVYGNLSTTAGLEGEAYTIALSKAAPIEGVTGGNLDKATVDDEQFLGYFGQSNATNPAAFDTYRGDGSVTGFVSLLDGNIDLAPTAAFTLNTEKNDLPLGVTGVTIQAGNGGGSSNGIGGAGGTIGGATLGDVTVNGSGIAETITGSNGLSFIAGNGGKGYLAGGAGGNLTGLKVDFDNFRKILPSSLIGGAGGNSETAKGGLGGSVTNNMIEGGTLFVGGNGGAGKRGGDGGSVIGKDDQVNFDTSGGGAIVQGGRGGDGSVAGGMGGSIKNFVNQLYIINLSGYLSYVAGDGGEAPIGAGGAGGSVVNCSPITAVNGFGGEIFLKGGDGGGGATGGNGGKVKDFQNQSTEGNPQLVTILGGNGGAGSDGKGGIGGNVVSVQASGAAYDSGTSTPEANLVLAGAGGSSTTGRGGNGGSVFDAKISAAGGAVVIGAGAGGSGGTKGGLGGSVMTVAAAASQISTGGDNPSVSKILITAGAGGNGGTAGGGGIGGLGGSIIGVKQQGNFLTNVDLIAGNGGSVGSGDATNSTVGKGGSISNVDLDGTIGDTSIDQPIISYSATLLADLRTAAIGHNGSGFPAAQVTNASGNVGLLAGAAGTLNGVVVASVKNGSVTNITARAIMSMIAGNVDNIAAIQKLQNVHLQVDSGVFGSDKGTQGDPDYIAADHVTHVSVPEIGGSLVDGAIFSVSPLVNNDGLGKAPTSDRVFSVNA